MSNHTKKSVSLTIQTTTTTSPIIQQPPSAALIVTCTIAAGAVLARRADGCGIMPSWLEMLFQLPVIALWLRERCHWAFSARPPHSKTIIVPSQRQEKLSSDLRSNRWLFLVVLLGSACMAAFTRRVLLMAIAPAIFITGSLLLEAILDLFQRVETQIKSPRSLIPTIGFPLLFMAIAATMLLALPIATRSSVPDYRHNFFLHILNSAFTAFSSASLVGTSIYSFAEDYSPFGQAVLVIISQLSGIAFCTIALAAVRPFLVHKVRLKTVLGVAFGMQIVAIIIMSPYWHDSDTPSRLARLWWSIVYAGSACWNTGTTFRPDGLAPYLSSPAIFTSLTALVITGSLGLPVLLDLVHKRDQPKTKTNLAVGRIILPAQKLPRFEAAATILLLLAGALLLFYFETPGALPSALVPQRPFDLGENQIALRDTMTLPQRWRLAVFVSATLRSAGLQSIPVSQGALSWPSYGLVLAWMFIGGSAGGVAGGVRLSSFLLPMICVFYRTPAWNVLRVRPKTSVAQASRLCTNRRHGSATGVLGRTLGGGSEVRKIILRRVCFIIVLGLGLSVFAGIALSSTSTHAPADSIFEATAAVNGVGLSTGLLPHLTITGRIVMIALIVAGRWLPSICWLHLADRISRYTSHS